VPTTVRNAKPYRRSRRKTLPLHLEALEARTLLAGGVFPLPSETLDQAKNLTPGAEAVGYIGIGPAGAADVDWYHFHLNSASEVTLATRDRTEGRALVSVLSLYNTADPFTGDPTVSDYYERLGHRLIAQSSGTAAAPDAGIDTLLGPGDYYVAVSGAGNLYFNPFLADSGYPSRTGDFALTLSTRDLGLGSSGPAVLRMDPASGGVLASSPVVVRLDLSTDWTADPSNYPNIQLIYSADGSFDASSTAVSVSYTYSPAAHELQLTPAHALRAGFYKVVIGVDGMTSLPLLTDPEGLSLQFQITGNEGLPPSSPGDDTWPYAHNLGDVTGAGLVQVAGAIGDDYIDDFTPFDMNDVDLYRFHVSGAGQYEISAEVFAGRIGSPLNAAVSLFRQDSSGLHLVAANADTTNPTLPTVPYLSPPLYNDPVIHAGLTAGDYFLAVSSGLNVPDPIFGLQTGVGGVFDPSVPNSGALGDSTGNYLLNFLVEPHTLTPRVVSVQRDDGIQPGVSPARFVVQFNEPINVQQLAYQAYQTYLGGGANKMPAVFVQGPGGAQYFPRLESYDGATNQAVFVMHDGLPSGVYQLHLSGAPSGPGSLGLRDFADNPLAGNDPASGDFVYTFSVHDPAHDPGNNPLHRYNQYPNADPQNLGVLFPNEIMAGVTVSRDFTTHAPVTPAADASDVYVIQVLQRQDYVFALHGTGLGAGVYPVLVNAANFQVLLPTFEGIPTPGNVAVRYTLDPGTYFVHIGTWKPANAGAVKYDLVITMLGNAERPTSLTIGPEPAVQLRIVSTVQPPPPPAPPPKTGDSGIPADVLFALSSGLLGGNPSGDAGAGRTVLPGLTILERAVALAPGLPKSDSLASAFQTLEYAVTDDTPVITAADQREYSDGFSLPDILWDKVIEDLFNWWNQLSQRATDLLQADTIPELDSLETLTPWSDGLNPWCAAAEPSRAEEGGLALGTDRPGAGALSPEIVALALGGVFAARLRDPAQDLRTKARCRIARDQTESG
jgi:hypothetical protein